MPVMISIYRVDQYEQITHYMAQAIILTYKPEGEKQ